MKLEILLATMHREDKQVLIDINANSDITVINQTNCESKEEFDYYGKSVLWINSAARGLSKSRNDAINNARNEVCILADDDMVYRDGYDEIVLEEFNANPDADIIVFGVESIESKKPVGLKTEKTMKLNYYMTMRACSVQIGIRVNKIRRYNLKYNEKFGPGGRYSMGDENIFLSECYKKGLKVYASKFVIADLHTCNSCWFNGFTEKYLFDRGAILTGMSKYLSIPYILRFALINYDQYSSKFSFIQSIILMLKGRVDYINYVGFNQ